MSNQPSKGDKHGVTSNQISKVVSTTRHPASPTQDKNHSKNEKWRQSEYSKGEKMAKKALEEESGGSSSFPIALKALELCPAPTRRHLDLLLSGYLAVKTSGGWTRKWQCRFIVLTPTFLYIYKRQPPVTEGSQSIGPEIDGLQSKSAANTRFIQPDDLDPIEQVIPTASLQKIMSAADTASENSHELFGVFRDGMPIDNDLAILEVPSLPHTFQLSYPGRPRLLLRAPNESQYSLWCNAIRATLILRANPPQVISSLIATKEGSAALTDELDLVPYVNEFLPAFVDRASIIVSTVLHSSAVGIASGNASNHGDNKPIVNSYTLNSQLIYKNNVVTDNTAHQGIVITNITPWGKRINVVLNNPCNPNAAFDKILLNDTVSISIGDGGFVCLPLSTLYSLYKAHQADVDTAASPSQVGGAKDSSSVITSYANGLFTVANSLYNCDMHIAFRFNQYQSAKKDKTQKRSAAASGAAAASSSGPSSVSKPSPASTISPIAGALGLCLCVYLAWYIRIYIDTSSTQGLITLWLTYLLLAVFSINSVGFVRNSQRQSLDENPNAILDHIHQAGGAHTSRSAGAVAGVSSSDSSSTPSTYHVLELIPIRIVDRHTLTGAVLLGGMKFDHDSYHPLPKRITATPTFSLLDALHHEVDGSIKTLLNDAHTSDITVSDDEDDDVGNSDSGDAEEEEEDGVYEMDAVLGRIYIDCWGKWGQADYRQLRLRGPDYLTNKKKIKIPALPHVYRTCFTSITSTSVAQPHAANWIGSYFHKQRLKAIELGKGHLWGPGTPLKYMVVNMLVPGNPNYNFIHYFRNPYIYPSPFPDDIQSGTQQEYHPSSPDKVCEYWGEGSHPVKDLIADFVKGDDAYRTSRFKYIPTVAEGGWFITNTVGKTPVILGNKLHQSYYTDKNNQYIEIDVDVASSSMAGKVLGLVKSYAKTLSLDLNYLLEPHHPDELPEGLWGGARVINIDLDAVQFIDPKPTPPEEYE